MAFEIPREVRLNPADIRLFFPPITDTQAKRLRMTNVALFSTTPPDQGEILCQLLQSFYGKDLATKTVTDANGCIGGNALELLKCVGFVNVVEISKLHMDIFKHNLKVLSPGTRNVKCFNANYIDLYLQLKQDIVFLDPPWGGLDYYKSPSLELYYSYFPEHDPLSEPSTLARISVTELVSALAKDLPPRKALAQTVVLKVPKNYNVQNLFDHAGYKYTRAIPIYRTGRDGKMLYYLLVLSHDQPRYHFTPKTVFGVNYRSIKYKL